MEWRSRGATGALLLAWWFMIPLPAWHRDNNGDGMKVVGPFQTRQGCEEVREQTYRKLVTAIEKNRSRPQKQSGRGNQIDGVTNTLHDIDDQLWEASVRQWATLPCDEITVKRP